jgi:hypothetical protein
MDGSGEVEVGFDLKVNLYCMLCLYPSVDGTPEQTNKQTESLHIIAMRLDVFLLDQEQRLRLIIN